MVRNDKTDDFNSGNLRGGGQANYEDENSGRIDFIEGNMKFNNLDFHFDATNEGGGQMRMGLQQQQQLQQPQDNLNTDNTQQQHQQQQQLQTKQQQQPSDQEQRLQPHKQQQLQGNKQPPISRSDAIDKHSDIDPNRQRPNDGLPPRFSVFADLKNPYLHGKDTPFFWHIPRSGGVIVKTMLSHCLEKTLAAEVGELNGHENDEVCSLLNPNIFHSISCAKLILHFLHAPPC